jgi:membrane AbrB-like protein
VGLQLVPLPGTISYVLAFAASGIGDIRSILVIQNIRLVLVTTLLPFILDHLGLRATPLAPAVTGTIPGSLAVIIPALAIGFSIRRWHIPASYLLVGMVCSGVAHYFDLVSGRPPSALIFFGFSITGSLVGTRFSAIPLADLKRLLGASFGSVILAGLLAAACAYPSAVLLDIPFGQVFVAFAPGGVEAMAAMAIALGYDPAYVATHHLFRICLLFLFVPLSIKIARRGASRRPG